MAENATDQQPEVENAAGLSPEEQASVEKGREGLSEVDPLKQPDNGPQRPEGVPEQFWKDGKVDVEGLAKSYAELRSKMDGGKKEEAPEAKEGEGEAKPATDAAGKIKPEAKDGEGEGDDAPNPLQSAMDLARNEWAETQEVSEETVEALEAAGIPRDVFNLYIEGLKAQTERDVAAIHGYAGGKDAYDQMTQWAAKTLSADEIEAFNEALDNPKLRETAVTGLLARYQKAAPNEGNKVTPTDSPAAGGDVFASRDELVAAQKDPRYQTDAAYRKEVMDKLARSQQGGFQAFARPMFERQISSSN